MCSLEQRVASLTRKQLGSLKSWQKWKQSQTLWSSAGLKTSGEEGDWKDEK